MIKCLPKEVQGRLRSGVALPSLQQCVEELILNSIDAEATCVGVRMDMEAFKVQVLDNGSGMSAEDMENVGNRYHTSKCSSVEDLDDLRWYGFRGEALASVVSLATLVEISSRTRTSSKTHVKMFKDGKGMDVFEADAARPSAGTTVVICSFFHNMPVRRKRMDAALEGERIRHRVEAISLMHPSVSFTLKNDCTGAMLVQLPKARNTYHRFIQIHGLGRAQKLREISHARGRFEVVGYIGREGHYNGSLQFLYVNERLLLRTRVHKMLNFLLRRLSSSNQKNNSPEWQSATRSPKHKRSQELHGVYIVNIKCSYSEYDICLEPAKTLIEFKDWDGILLCVEEAVKAFLSRENLVAVLSHDDLDPRESFGVGNADQEGHAGDRATIDCGIGMKLASDSVHRKRQDDNAPEGGVCQESGEEEAEHLWQKPKTESEGSINKERNDEPPCDPARQEPASDNDSTERDESISSESGEGSQTLHKSGSVRLENEELEVTEKGDVRLNDTTSTNDVTLPDVTGQTSPDRRGVTGGHGQASCDRKIGLSDPYVHENLKTRDLPLSSKSVFPQQILVPKCKERPLTFKRKISLDASPDASCQKWHNASVVPSKIHRPVTCQKLSLCQQSGSLEKFRRVYGKSNEMKPPSQETLRENNTRFAQTDSFVFNRQNALVCQKDQQNVHVREKEETRSSRGTPPSLSDFTKLKPGREQDGGKQSLAAKLRHLKHGAADSKASPLLPGAVSQDSARLNDDGLEDHNNNNEGDADDPPGPEPVPGRGASPPLAERGEATPSGDWVQHYDASAGKTVYVNRVTGLSRYGDVTTEERKARCTSDITNIAVSVISETGMEYRCYPFRVELVLPFLPKSRTERVLSSGLDDRDEKGEGSNSLTSLYSKWNNPVFVRPPTVAVDISSGQADGLAVKIHNILFPYRFSKAMIQSMKVINQVDKKFLACLINTREEEPAGATHTEGNLLVLVDQHAAHERVRLENLVADSYEDDPDSPGERRLCSSIISPPLEISLTEEEQRLLRSCLPRLRSLGLELKLSQAAESQVLVGKVPLCFMEKESNELRRGRPSVIKPIVEVYLREQIELFRSTGTVRGTLPLTVLKVLASLACHGAIKFNDTLSRDECYSLVALLSSCSLPFQCAHGRPSIAPLVDILHLDKDQEEFQKPNLQKLRRMYKAWELYGNR